MVSRDMIAQLRQDVTTAEDAGDDATAQRLRAELAAAVEAARRGEADDEQ
ncbi:hypothetical protein OHA40_30075 [Nocardia sp. NBC_00508]|nr:hypothetical protein [Nocardia sp. NBC_00508]WUD65810.1 hypothetical protein OHA40_30075 [Nocardia sp. NBC_00508]